MFEGPALPDSRAVKLGKRPAKHDSRTLQLAKYTATVALAPPVRPANTSAFGTTAIERCFQVERPKVDGKPLSPNFLFIPGIRHSLDVATCDRKNPAVLKALKTMPSRVQLHYLQDAYAPETSLLGR